MKERALPPASPPSAKISAPDETMGLQRRHQLFGWWALLVFLTLGLVLEFFHGLKLQAYVRVSNETRRLMWTLAHAHGTLLALVNLAFTRVLHSSIAWKAGIRNFASTALLAASVLMPAGFLLGGTFIYGGDPGLGILLVPLGGIFLFVAVLSAAIAVTRE